MNSSAKNNLSFFIGSGNGFVYQLSVDRKKLFEKKRHNVHFSPVTYYTRYGMFFTLFLYLLTLGYFIKISKLYNEETFTILLSYQIFAFALSFISFSLSLDLLFWISIGLTLQMYTCKREKYYLKKQERQFVRYNRL